MAFQRPFPLRHPRLAAAALAAALALPALARQQQPPAPPAGASATAAQDGARQPRHQRWAQPGDRAQHRAQRLAALKDQLKLTPAQEPAWAAFTAALQPGERKARLDLQDMEKLTTPERIDRMRALRAQHAADADRRGEATKAFYAALTPEQQKTFDARAMHRPGHFMKDGGPHRHHPGPDGMRPGMRGGPEGRPAPAGAKAAPQ